MKSKKTLIALTTFVAMFLVTSILFPLGGVGKAKAIATYGNATAADLLSGKTATVNAGQITGTFVPPPLSKLIVSSSDTSINATNYWQVGYYTGRLRTVVNTSSVSIALRNDTHDQTAVTKTTYSMKGLKNILIYYKRDTCDNVYIALSTTQSDSVSSNVVRSWILSDGGGKGTSSYFRSLDVSGLTGDYYIKFGFTGRGGSGTTYDWTLLEMFLIS